MQSSGLAIIPSVGTDCNNNICLLAKNLHKREINVVRYTMNRSDIDEQISFLNNLQEHYHIVAKRDLRLWLDLSWPKDKIRLEMSEYPVALEKGEVIFITNDATIKKDSIRNAYMKFNFRDLKSPCFMVGESLMVRPIEANDDYMLAECLNSDIIKSSKAVSSIDNYIEQSSQEIEERAMKLIHDVKVELCILSYIESRDDYIKSTAKIQKFSTGMMFMSKIESFKGFLNRKEIIDISDSIMIPRGCLALNLGISYFWGVQNTILRDCILNNRKVYLASNILRSLDKSIIPSRTDIGDLANFVSRGVSDVILTNAFNTKNMDALDRYYIYIHNIYELYHDRDFVQSDDYDSCKLY
ncbi:MAG: hypothetical protein LBL96_06120 [Clostridiales bacterium]|jgi:pyruvate kinase|nr:hypothetical protein [Clostridiales bacterium]